jgi:O-antigen ligase
MSSAIATANLRLPSVQRKVGTDSLVLTGVFGLLFLGPLAFGAVEAWAVFVLEASTALLFSLWAWRQAGADEWNIRDNPLFRPMLLFGTVVLVQLVLGWTAYRHDTFSQALLYVAYGLLAFLVVQCLRRSSQAKALAVAISTYGVAVAGFALLQGLSPNGKLYWIRTPRFGGSIYGPYVNHNHYAGLMEMLIPVPLVFCLSRYARGRIRMLVAGGAALMVGTIFISGSRGGMVAVVVELIVLGVVLVRMEHGAKAATAIGIFGAMVLGILVWIGGGALGKRLLTIGPETKHELSGGLRWTVNKDGIRMFARKPILGWGLGTFPTAYPRFRTFYTNFFVNEAHDDYLQLLVETGVVGFALMLWFLVRLYRNAAKKLSDWPNDINGAVALACLLGCTGILVHSFVDFNLQIPANAAWFYVLCVIAASPYPLETRQRVRRPRSSRLRPPEFEEIEPEKLEPEGQGSTPSA